MALLLPTDATLHCAAGSTVKLLRLEDPTIGDEVGTRRNPGEDHGTSQITREVAQNAPLIEGRVGS